MKEIDELVHTSLRPRLALPADEVCNSVLQCVVAVCCCSVLLQCVVAVCCCSVLQCVVSLCTGPYALVSLILLMRCATVCCDVLLQCVVARCCSVL